MSDGKRKRYELTTTLYGQRMVSRAQLYELHREVARAASRARRDDPIYMERYEMGKRFGSPQVQRWFELLRFKREHENESRTEARLTS